MGKDEIEIDITVMEPGPVPWDAWVDPAEDITERIVIPSCNWCECTGRVNGGTCPECLGYVIREKKG